MTYETRSRAPIPSFGFQELDTVLRAHRHQRAGQRHVEPVLQAPYTYFPDLYDPVGSDSEYLL